MWERVLYNYYKVDNDLRYVGGRYDDALELANAPKIVR